MLVPCVLLVLASAFPLASQVQPEAQASGPLLVIEHVTVLTMTSAEPLLDHSVLVHGERIVALAPAATLVVPPAARRIDGRGRFLMPGLADMHVHVWDESDLHLLVANGVTCVRNLFGDPLQLEWRARIQRGELVGPRIYTAGPIIDGKPVVWPGSVELTDPDDAARVVAEQQAAGYDFLKPYANLTPECYEALAIAAEEAGMPLMGHVPEALTLADVLTARQATIEHLGGWAEAAQRPGSSHGRSDFGREFPAWTRDLLAWTEVSDERLAECAAAMRAAGTWNCPTLVVLQKWAQGDAARAALARPEMRYVAPATLAAWAPDSPVNYLGTLPAAVVEAAHAALPHQGRAIAALRDAGAGILLGTDAGNPFVVAGFALHEELELLVAAGLSPYEALRAGTAEAARSLQAEGEWGSVCVGARADLLLLSANPLVDVRHARQRVGVLLNGRWFPEEELQAELERRALAFEAR